MSDDRMSTELEGNQPTDSQGPAGPEERGLMTPWLRRRFGLDREPGQRTGARRGRPAGVTTGRIRMLLARVRQTRERARVWKPDIGSLRPELIQQFGGEVTRRHQMLQLVGVRRSQAAQADHWRDALDLALPTGSRAAEAGTRATPSKLTGPSIFTVGQQIPQLRTDALSAGRSSRPPRKPSRPASQPQVRDLPPRARLFARVEEVAPAGRERSSEGAADEPVQREADLEPQEPAGETVLPETDPRPEGERPLPSTSEPAPPRGQPTIQRKTRAPQAPAPPRRQQKLPRKDVLPDQETPAPPPERERAEPPMPPPEPETAERQVDEELPLGPAPGAPVVTPPRKQVLREPGEPHRGREAPRQPDGALRQPSEAPPSPVEPFAHPERQQQPARDEEERAVAGPASSPSPPVEPAETERHPAPRERPVDRPQPAGSDAEPMAPAAKGAGLESAVDMVLRQPAVPPQSRAQPIDASEPVGRTAAPGVAPEVQRQAQDAADKPIAPALTVDGRRILARASSRARSTLTRLLPSRHHPPEVGAAEARRPAPSARPGILSRIQHRRWRPSRSPVLYGRGPAVQIGPEGSLPVTRHIPPSRPQREPGQEQPGGQAALSMPSQARALVSAPEGGIEGPASERGLPLRASSVPAARAARGVASRGSVADSGRMGGGLPGGGSEPPGLPPPPPEGPSLPLARPPAPRPIGGETAERPSSLPDVLQREPEGPVGTLQAGPALVQREGEDDESSEEIDLSELAQQVYPMIKRLLSIERERAHGRPA